MAKWNPYDQNTPADWFDAGYMFGVHNGFDVVIGNPPYVQLQKDGGRLGRLYRIAACYLCKHRGHLSMFCERGCQLLTQEQGILAYITSNSWLKAEYGKSLRSYFAEDQTPILLMEWAKMCLSQSLLTPASCCCGLEGTLIPHLPSPQLTLTG